MKLLMHACCGPCSVYCVDSLKEKGIIPTMYWYNPNIHPYTEYRQRKDAFIQYCKIENLDYIIDENYGLDNFCKEACKDLKNRCTNYCYPVRLNKLISYAEENGYDSVTTTLLYSIYQKHDYIKKYIEDKVKDNKNLSFYYEDFRQGFRQGQEKARALGLYMQKYCGCIFSEEERYNNSNKTKIELSEDSKPTHKETIQIKRIDNKKDYIDLLLDADPSKDMIMKYLKLSDVYGLEVDEKIVSVAVILPILDDTVELKNLVTIKEYRDKGYAGRLLKLLFGNYKQKYNKMIVGTTENNIPFYVKQGFDKYEKTIKNFFVDNYNEEIWDGDVHCMDMYYYSKYLKNKGEKS